MIVLVVILIILLYISKVLIFLTIDHQGLTAKQWSEKGTGGHFGGVVLSPSYRHVRLYLKHIHIYFNTRCVKMGECFSQTKI